jgi:hypothetical protein
MATRCVREYVCPAQQNFSLQITTGAVFKAIIVRHYPILVYIVDPGVGTTVNHTYKVVDDEEPFDPAGLTWLGTVDYRGNNWYVGEVESR